MNGCSFVAAMDIKLSTSKLLSKKLGCVEHNIAQPGGSQDGIIKN